MNSMFHDFIKDFMQVYIDDKERVAIVVGKNKLSQEVYIIPKWQSTSFFAIASSEERRCVGS